MTIGVNAHYIFNVANKISVYPLVGLGYAHCKATAIGIPDLDENDWGGIANWETDIDDYGTKEESGSANKFFFNVGVGAEYAINDKISIGAEIKYQYIENFNRLPISLGVAYKF